MRSLQHHTGTPGLQAGVLALVLCLCGYFSVSEGHAQPDRYVIHVIIDGARYSETLGDTLARYTPRMQQLGHQGTVVETFLNDGYTYTSRAIPAIWCGSWAAPRDTVVSGFSTQYAAVPTVWEYFRKYYPVDSTQALRVMKYLTGQWLPSFFPGYGPKTWPYYVLQGSSDLDVWATARQKLQTHHPRLSEIYLADVDSYGHSGDWNAYTHAIRTADSIVGMLWDVVQSDPLFVDKTTLLVSNDHGRHLDGVKTGFVGHGDNCWGCMRIMFLGVGASVGKGVRVFEQKTLLDITPTIGAILQFPTPYASGSPITGILAGMNQNIAGTVSETFALLPNYPNPFNAGTVVSYQLPVARDVTVTVYDVLGREVASLVNGKQEAGSHSLHWNAGGCASGVYICRLQAGSCVTSRTLVLAR